MEFASAAKLRPRRYLLHSYQQRVLGIAQHLRREEEQQMHRLAVTELCELPPHLRLRTTMVYIIEKNLSQNPHWNMLVAAEVMKRLEKYAWNLIDYPWKKEFLTIKTYSGFYKTHIEPHISNVECLFGLLGYKLNSAGGQYEITDEPSSRECLAEMAFEFYIAGIELEICHAITCRVGGITVAEVYHCRSHCPGTISSCVQKLQEEQNVCSYQQSCMALLTTSDYVEPLQPVTESESLAEGSANKSHLAVNEATSRNAFTQSLYPSLTSHEHNACSLSTCFSKQCTMMHGRQPKSVGEISVDEVKKDENCSQSRPTTELHDGEIVSRKENTWECSSCTFVNTVTVNFCEMCYICRS